MNSLRGYSEDFGNLSESRTVADCSASFGKRETRSGLRERVKDLDPRESLL